MKSDSEVVTILILESGASWPSWGTGLRMRAPNAIVEVQMDAESVDAFEARVLERIRKADERGDSVIAAGYACGRSDGSRDASRLRVGEALLEVIRPLSAGQSGRAKVEIGGSDPARAPAELIVAGGAWEFTGDDAEERERVLALWSTLSTSSPGKIVSVRFEDAPYDSGVFRFAYQADVVSS